MAAGPHRVSSPLGRVLVEEGPDFEGKPPPTIHFLGHFGVSPAPEVTPVPPRAAQPPAPAMALPHGLGLLLLLLLGGPGAAITIPPECEWGGGGGACTSFARGFLARSPPPPPFSPCTAAHDRPVAPYARGLGGGEALLNTVFLPPPPPLHPGMQTVHTIVSLGGGPRGGGGGISEGSSSGCGRFKGLWVALRSSGGGRGKGGGGVGVDL